MNQLNVQQRKMVYAAIAVLLIIPIVFLGSPAGEAVGTGGLLAKSRYKNELGEASLGKVDPTSSTMNLVLLGLRGVAASVLWQKADHYKQTKNFSQLENTVESIILLQPHFKSVWEYQAWNLAFNVSAECDAVEDRFHWVKRGAKFMIRGSERNQKVPELFFETGRFFGQKIGRADEKNEFRKFFVNDPDQDQWKGGPDEEINPEGEDNYLVSSKWYKLANEALEYPGVEQHKMDLALFLAYPYRSLMDYAIARQEDGIQEDLDAMSQKERNEAYQVWAEITRKAWEKAYDQWTGQYGQQEIMTAGGGVIVMEPNMDKLQELAEAETTTLENKKEWQARYHKTTNYTYWKKRCEIEKREKMMQAHYMIAEGRRLHRDVGATDDARVYLAQGMELMEGVINQYDREDGSNSLLDDEESMVEEGLKAILVWRHTYEFVGEKPPEKFPLDRLWTSPQFQSQRDDLIDQFQAKFGAGTL